MTTGDDQAGVTLEYTLDGAAILAVPAGTIVPQDLLDQLRDEGFVKMVKHWYDAHSMRDYAEFHKGD